MAYEVIPYDSPPSPVRQSRYADPGKEIIVHNGEYVVSRTDENASVGTGSPDFIMGTGTPEEIDAEIARLDLLPEPPIPEPEIPEP